MSQPTLEDRLNQRLAALSNAFRRLSRVPQWRPDRKRGKNPDCTHKAVLTATLSEILCTDYTLVHGELDETEELEATPRIGVLLTCALCGAKIEARNYEQLPEPFRGYCDALFKKVYHREED